jgi:hypothetical protein
LTRPANRIGAAIALALAVSACASMEAPPGGPRDSTAPVIIRVIPDTNAVNSRGKYAIFEFDEVVSQQSPTGGDLQNLFLISPSAGAVVVEWGRDAIEVRPRAGWKPNTTYTVTLLPGLSDLSRNTRKEGGEIVFSTGPELATSSIRGTMFDWVAGRVARGYVEAISRPDSVVYVAAVDTAGQFVIRNMPRGEYTVRGVIDANSNRAIDPREPWDSVRTALADTTTVEILAYSHDTLPPTIVSVTAPDTFTIRAILDRALDPAQPVDVSRFSLIASDSARIPLAEARAALPYEREAARPGLPSDSVGRGLPGGVRVPTRDSTPPTLPGQAPPIRTIVAVAPSKPSPVIEIVITPSQPLRPGTEYRLGARDLRSISGAVGPPTSKVFTVPKPRAPTDSATIRGGPPPPPPPPQ